MLGLKLIHISKRGPGVDIIAEIHSRYLRSLLVGIWLPSVYCDSQYGVMGLFSLCLTNAMTSKRGRYVS